MVVRRAVLGFLAVVLALAAGPGLASAASGGPVPVVVLNGRGWGHGVGMSQDGAYWEGRAGLSAYQILGGFYPGVRIGRSSGQVRVVVVDGGGPATVVGFPSGGQVRDALSGTQSRGFPVNVPPGGQVQVAGDGGHWTVTGVNFSLPPVQLTAFSPTGSTLPVTIPTPSTTTTTAPGTTTTTAPHPTTTLTPPPPTAPPPTTPPPGGPGGPTTTAPPATSTTSAPPPHGSPPPAAPGIASSTRPLWAVPAGASVLTVPSLGRSYRGVIQTGWGSSGIQLINQLDVESYLKGMGEVLDGSWPLAALETQSIAARTYALRAMAISGQICADDRCQVYLGAQVEYPAMDRAVDATAHQVLVFAGQLASALYSANGGGFEADPSEAFGPTGASYPYLRPAPYETQNPMPWAATIALSDVGARLGYPGQVTGVAVTQKGPSGRATQVTISGSRGEMAVAGYQFAASLGLRSTLFTPVVGTAAAAPPPPPTQSLIQEAPGAVVEASPGPPSLLTGPGGSRRPGTADHAAVLLAALGFLGLVGAPAGRLAWRRRGPLGRVATRVLGPVRARVEPIASRLRPVASGLRVSAGRLPNPVRLLRRRRGQAS